MKDQEHIDDVTSNISISHYTEEEQYSICSSDKVLDYLAQELKLKAYKLLEDNPKLKASCKNSYQMWLTFYSDKKDKGATSIMKMCYYREGVLYYPCESDNILYREKRKEWDANKKVHSFSAHE